MTTPGLTYPGLDPASDVQGTDLLATYRSPGPLKRATAALLLSYVAANIGAVKAETLVPVTVVASNPRLYTLTPVTGYPVFAAGANQTFVGFADATNTEGQTGSPVRLAIAGVFSGAVTDVVMPNGDNLPAGVIQANSPFAVQPSSVRGKYVLVYPAFTTQDTFVMLEWVSGTGASVVAKIAFPSTKLSTDLSNIRFAFQAQGDKPAGGGSLTIRNFANTADILAATNIYDKTGTTQITEADAWLNKQWVEVTRDPSTGRVKLVEYPSTTLTTAVEQDASLAIQRRTVLEPVFAQKLTSRVWAVDVPVIYDDDDPATSTKMNQDYHRVIMYDYGRAMSQGVLKSAYAWAINSNLSNIAGNDYDYGLLYSDEIGGGAFEGDQPSTFEWAFPVGLYADSSSGYIFYGFSHVQMALAGTPTITMDGGSSLLTAAVGTRERGSSMVFTATYDVYRPPTLSPVRIGQVTVVHTLNANGLTVAHTHKIGRTMAYTSGNLNVAEGTTITGATSGATAILVVAPTPTTGSYGGGNAAGQWYVKTVTGTFQNGENLQTAGVTRAVMSGTIGAQIGVDNAYAAMMPTTTVTGVKVPSNAEIVIGYEDGAQQPVSLGGTWTGQNRMQFRQPIAAPTVIHEVLLNGNAPFDPPGNYSLALGSQMFVQDRTEGNRKGYANWVSNGKQVYEGTYTGNQTYRFRVGALV